MNQFQKNYVKSFGHAIIYFETQQGSQCCSEIYKISVLSYLLIFFPSATFLNLYHHPLNHTPCPNSSLDLSSIFLQKQKLPDMSSLSLVPSTFRCVFLHRSFLFFPLSKRELLLYIDLTYSLGHFFLCPLQVYCINYFPVLVHIWSFPTDSFSIVNSHILGSSNKKYGF